MPRTRTRCSLRSIAAPCTLLGALAACAAEKPPPPPQQAPLAATPLYGELLHTSARPTREGAELKSGEATALRGCPSDPHLLLTTPGGGLLLRFSAPVPTDLALQLDTSLGLTRVMQPQGLDDEERFARTGRPYFYENDALSRTAPTGAVAPREIYLWPGPRSGDLSLELQLRDLSFSPGAVGEERESAPLRISLVGRCPDIALVLLRDSVALRPGETARIHARVTPSGDGLKIMTVAFEVAGAPPGVTVALADAQLSAADWTIPRETAFLITVPPDAQPGKATLTLHARLGAIDRTAPLALTLLPKDDY